MKYFFFLLLFLLVLPRGASVSYAATQPAAPVSFSLATENNHVVKPQKKGTGLFAKWKQKLLAKAIKKGWLGDGEMTERQKKQGRWSLILGLGSLVLLILPYIGLLAIPAAIVGLVLGIKSVQGNSNTNGIIGIIASGLTLVLLILAVALLAVLLASWN